MGTGKWQFVPVLWVNGSPRPDTIVVDGKPIKHKSEGTFYLDWRHEGKRVQKPCGKSPREALDAWRTKSAAEPDGGALGEQGVDPDGRGTVDAAITGFLAGIRGIKSPATVQAYGRDLKWFRRHCGKTFVAEIGRAELLELFAARREGRANQKTINRRVLTALMTLRNAGSEVKFKKGDWPKTENGEVEVYGEEQVFAFLQACTPSDRLIFKTFLSSGMRSRELATLYWADIDYDARTLTVRAKPELEFKPKSHESRSINVPRSLIEALRVRERTSTTQLVFPTAPHPKRKNYGRRSSRFAPPGVVQGDRL